MADPFIAEIRVFGFNFAPVGWALCNGQILPISQNTALFSLLGTTYGGNGINTFALPNLQDSFAMHWGQGPGLSQRDLGEQSGSASVTLLASEMPSHGHILRASAGATGASPAGATLAPPANGAPAYRAPSTAAAMAGDSLSSTGGGLPHENRQPFQTLNFCIALQGIFPSRN
jgi:microcystin-dependent protein